MGRSRYQLELRRLCRAHRAGTVVQAAASFLQSLLGGGILGALLFYLITNTAVVAVQLLNPEYAKTFSAGSRPDQRDDPAAPKTWDFPQHAGQRRIVHRPVRRRDEIDSPAESPAEKKAGVRENRKPKPEEAGCEHEAPSSKR